MARDQKKRFEGVLLASDFDGTFVPSTKIVQEEVREALRWFIREGGLFTVSTGRTYLGFHAYSPEYINAPVLLANGGMAYDYARDKVVLERGIGEEGLEPVSAIASEFPELSIELYPMNRAYAIHLSAQSEHHFNDQDIPFSVIGDPQEAPRPWIKAMLNGDNAVLRKAQTFLEENFPQVGLLPASGSFLEILGKGVNKGNAVLQLAEMYGIAGDHICCAGDGYNDVDMLRIAAKAFVPADGAEEAVKCADYLVRTCENGCIAHVIEILDRLYGR